MNILLQKTYMCGGTLITRNTIVTAAHCIVEIVDFVYNFKTYYINVEPNSYYPTKESMYKVYLGLHNNEGVFNGSDISPSVEISIKTIIKVNA